MLLDINDILGKPYKAHGRGPDGFDCYGLVIEVEKRLGKNMPDLYEKMKHDGKDIHDALSTSKEEGYIKVSKPEFGDVVIMFNKKGQIHHTGVYLKNDDFIHCDKYGVRISRLREFAEKKEVYRCQN